MSFVNVCAPAACAHAIIAAAMTTLCIRMDAIVRQKKKARRKKSTRPAIATGRCGSVLSRLDLLARCGSGDGHFDESVRPAALESAAAFAGVVVPLHAQNVLAGHAERRLRVGLAFVRDVDLRVRRLELHSGADRL